MKSIHLLNSFIILIATISSLFAQQPPNIVWLMAEDMSTDLECYGMPNVKTPNLNKMAAEGIKFENCFVTNPICSPSRSSMMVGTHQYKINAHHHRSNRNIPLQEPYKPFTYWLRKAGYTCVLGNTNVLQKGRKTDVNFKHDQIGDWDPKKNSYGLFDKYDTFEKADEPFFAQIQLNVTHRGHWWNDIRNKSAHPVDPKTVTLPPYLGDHPAIRLDWAKYLDTVEYMDGEVGAIFKELEAKGVADNTIVIFIGDNGRCNVKGKGYLHDSGLRIPFIIHYPKKFKKASVRSEVVSSTDITASILKFAGIPVPNYMTGKPLFNKEEASRDYVYARRDLWDEVEEQSSAITSHKWKYIRNDKTEVPFDSHQAYLEFYRPAVHVMRQLKKEGKLNAQQKAFFEPNKPKEELYLLTNDKFEKNNLASDKQYQSILIELREKTKQLDLEMKPKSEVCEPVYVTTAIGALEWIIKEKPEVYEEMKKGVEVGYKKWIKEYKKHLKQMDK